MPEYDFSTLSSYDFELLTRDLLQKELGVRLESFKTGRDKGIDLRYSTPDDSALSISSPLIVQCKHYLRSGFSKLKSILKNEELQKIEKLNPSRYILATSLELTPTQKDELVELLSPFCLGPNDVFGSNDLNNLLGRHNDVERQHFKLWLPSTEVLQRLLHNRVFTQSALEIDDIKKQLSLFVRTDAVDRGLSLMEKHGYCMFSGIPGIGKTTTARILVALHVHQGWEAFYISHHIGDALQLFRSGEKQVFFYDDFLGQTSLAEKLSKNEDKELLQLIRACQKEPTEKRLVLTTREYLFEQAKQQHEVLSRSRIDMAACTVQLSDYTRTIRAEILVNHLYFHGIDAEICSQFVISGDARQTLDHPNYNPRIVEAMCSMQRQRQFTPKEFGGSFLKLLDSPEEIWGHAYHSQLSSNARRLLLVFAILEDSVTIHKLKEVFRVFVQRSSADLFGFDITFKNCIEELEGNFLLIHPHDTLTFATYHNPSVKDFTERELSHDRFVLEVALKELTLDQPLIKVARLLTDQAASEIKASEILAALRRSDYSTAYRVAIRDKRIVKARPLSRFESLIRWTQVVSTLGDSMVSKGAIACIEDFLREADPRCSHVTFFVELYSRCRLLAKLSGTELSLSATELAGRIVGHCQSPDEFLAAKKLCGRHNLDDEIKLQLKRSFGEQGQDWLDSVVESASDPGEIDEAIDTLVDVAKELGVSDDSFDTGLAHERAEELERAEDAEAVQRLEDTILDVLRGRQDSSAADDILDSLRD